MELASSYIKEELIIPEENDIWDNINLECVNASNNRSKVDHNEFSQGIIQTSNNISIDISSKFKMFCPKCDKSFKYLYSRPVEKCNICDTVLFIYCLNCNLQYRQQNLVIKHAQESCEPAKNFKTVKFYFCDHCNYVTTERCSLTKHLKIKHVELFGKNTYQCPKCNEIFTSFGSNLYHQMSCGKPFLECELCHYKTRFNTAYRKHLQIHQILQIFPKHKENISTKSISKKRNSKDAIKIVNDKVEKKGKRRKEIRKIDDLIKIHCMGCKTKNIRKTSIRNCPKCKMSIEFHCLYPNCGAKYCRICNIRIHIEKEHVNEDEFKLSKCTTCNKVFIHPKNLLSHKKGCSMGPYIKCDHCDFTTRWSGSLAKHRKRHHKDLIVNKYTCEKCQKGFSSVINLRHHSWYCGQNRITFRCAHCFYSTISKKALIVHLKLEHQSF